jgi:two-component system, cell cycle sensor histidine kinase and response regulator CckA
MSAITPLPIAAPRLVLVADDEPAIQYLVTRVIDQLGLVALPVSDGAAAIMAVAARQADLICVVLDITMPLVNGVDAARVIQRLAPDLAIVLMSGAIPADYAVHINQLRLAGLLHKPFPLAALRKLIRHAAGDDVAIEAA